MLLYPSRDNCIVTLQAKWVEDISELSLRANVVLPLIERGRQYHMAQGR